MLLDDEEYKHVERRCWTRQWMSRREERGAYYTIFKELAIKDSSGFAEYMRMPHNEFNKLLKIIGPSVHTILQDSIFFITSITILLVVTFHPEGEESSDCSGCLSCSTCPVTILNCFLRDHGKIIDAPSLVDLNFVTATCCRSVHMLRQGRLRLFCRCDMSHEFKPV